MHIKEIVPYSLQEGCALHRHSGEYELVLFYLGRGTFISGNRKIPFTSPALFLVPPYVSHRVKVDPQCRLVRIYGLIFTWPTGSVSLKKKVRRRLGDGLTPPDTSYLSVFDGIRRRHMTGDPFLVRAAQSLFMSFLYDICAEKDMEPVLSDNPHILEAVRILRDSVYETITADALAEKTGLHKAYLIRLFRKHMGTTPMRYLTDYRIDGTAWQLEHTDKPVHQIAREFLFYDEFHFSRVFKERKGMPPQQFRNMMRKKPRP